MPQPAVFRIKKINQEPWVLPNNGSPDGLSFAVANVAGTATVPQDITKGSFRLKFTNADALISAGADLKLYDQEPQGRKAVRAAFDAFVVALDSLQKNGSLAPGAARLIVQALAQYLPLPLAEVPLYYFNMVNPTLYKFLSQAQTYIDLLPGMRLQVCHSNMNNEPGVAAGKNYTAYTGTGIEELYVNSITGSGKISFNPFLNQLKINVPASSASKIRMAAGDIDLMDSDELQPYNRLFYPGKNNFRAVDTPNYSPVNNAVLVRAATYADMITYTGNFPSCCQGKGVCTMFFGRTEIVPEISVRVNGAQRYVPVGTTLKHMVEREYQTPVRPKNLRFTRQINQSAVDVAFEDSSIGFNMFLVQGDEITW